MCSITAGLSRCTTGSVVAAGASGCAGLRSRSIPGRGDTGEATRAGVAARTISARDADTAAAGAGSAPEARPGAAGAAITAAGDPDWAGLVKAGTGEFDPPTGMENAGTVMSGRTGVTGLRTTTTAVTHAAAVVSCGHAKSRIIRGPFPSPIAAS